MENQVFKIVPNSWNGTGAYYTAKKITRNYSYGKKWERFETIERRITDGRMISFSGREFSKSELCLIEPINN